MEKIADVSLGLTFQGERIEIQENGYVGRLTPGQASIEVVTLHDHLHGFTVDGRKNILPKRNLSHCEGERHYEIKIQIKAGLNGVYYTEYPQNNLRLLEIGPDGALHIWEIALISQDGDFFLTTQKTYETYCYREGGKLICPRFAEWPQLVDFIKKIVGDGVKKIPAHETPDKENSGAPDLAPNTGYVLWFNHAQGIGAIQTPDGTARVHWRQIARRNRLAFLASGEIVRYASLDRPTHTKARPTSFKKEVLGVTPL